MIKPPSLQKETTLIYSGDPALRLPEDKEEAERLLNEARHTGDWSKLLTGEEQPTLFHVAPISRSQRDWLLGEAQHSSTLGRPMHSVEFDALVLRAALVRVDNFGAHKVERIQHRPHGQYLAKSSIIDAIHAEAGPDVIPELVATVWERATQPIRPL